MAAAALCTLDGSRMMRDVRAVTIVDGQIVVADRPEPVPGSGELLVAVRAAGINGADLLQLRGHYPAPPGVPQDMPGLEMAGEVIAAGPDVGRFQVGDRVTGLVPGAAQAERVVIAESVALPVPQPVGWAAAGGFSETFSTAHDALFSQAGLLAGDRLLVHGAAGGVGSAAVQLAVRAGASVVASVRRPEVRGPVVALGATVVAPHDVEDHGPFDVILELVGAQNLDLNLSVLAIGGRIMVIGVGAGARTELDLRILMGRRGRILGSTLRTRTLEERSVVASRVEADVLPLLADGRVHVPVERAYPLEDAAAAYARFAEGAKFGKVVLTV